METSRLMMTGTGGGLDYLVVARNGNVGMGIKPYTESSYVGGAKVVMFGFNLRSARHPEAEEDAEVGDFKEAWPGGKFSKHDHERASIMLLGPVKGKRNTDYLQGNFTAQNVMHHLVELVHTVAGEHQTIDDDAIIEFLSEHFDPVLKTVDAPGDDNVIDFGAYIANTQQGKPNVDDDPDYGNEAFIVQADIEEDDE